MAIWMFKIRWKNAGLSGRSCWQASIDGGESWTDLTSDNKDDSSEAVDEASEEFGMSTNKWEVEY